MSSSHLFLGLPIALFVLYLELRSGHHSAAFFSHLSLGDVAILSANFHFIFCVSCSSIESWRVPSFPLHLQCFFMYSIQSSSSITDDIFAQAAGLVVTEVGWAKEFTSAGFLRDFLFADDSTQYRTPHWT